MGGDPMSSIVLDFSWLSPNLAPSVKTMNALSENIIFEKNNFDHAVIRCRLMTHSRNICFGNPVANIPLRNLWSGTEDPSKPLKRGECP